MPTAKKKISKPNSDLAREKKSVITGSASQNVSFNFAESYTLLERISSLLSDCTSLTMRLGIGKNNLRTKNLNSLKQRLSAQKASIDILWTSHCNLNNAETNDEQKRIGQSLVKIAADLYKLALNIRSIRVSEESLQFLTTVKQLLTRESTAPVTKMTKSSPTMISVTPLKSATSTKLQQKQDKDQYKFPTKKSLTYHFEKHKKEFGYVDIATYETKALKVIEKGEKFEHLHSGRLTTAYCLRAYKNVFHFVAVSGSKINTYHAKDVGQIEKLKSQRQR